jgi:low temperature requirement protein LtrA
MIEPPGAAPAPSSRRARLVQTRRRHDESARASYMELFFDLVFVLVVTELSSVLYHDLSLRGWATTGFLLLVAWWAWIYTTWTTNWFDTETLPVRLVLLVGMVASMVGAVSIPDAFGDRAPLLVLGYVGLQVVRNTFVVLATHRGDRLYLPLVRFWRWNAAVGVIWVAGALVDDGARVAVWLVALALDYAGPFVGHWSPRLGRTASFEWELVPSHFAERIYLFVIIALGDSIVSTGTAVARLPITGPRLLALLAALLLAAAYWWLYFDYHARRAEEELARAGRRRGALARDLSYMHVPIIGGIIASSVASDIVVVHPVERLSSPQLLVLGAGPVLYLLGGLGLKLRVIGVVATQRLIAAALVSGAVALGTVLDAVVVWSIVVLLLAALAALETQERVREVMQVGHERPSAGRSVESAA